MSHNKLLDKYSSGDLVVYPQQGRVNIKGEIIRLGPVNMRVLVVLLENQGHVVSRSMLLETVWKNQIISDDTLTRCISDIRNQLGKVSIQDVLIETIPKKGYRWVPKLNKVDENGHDINKMIRYRKKQVYYWLLIGLISMLVLSTSLLWVTNQFFKNDKVSIALMPIQATESNIELAYEIEESLRKAILSTNKMRYLSSTVLEPIQQNNFGYLYNELGTKWMIEGRIRASNSQFKLTLNLVDMRTALVMYSKTVETNQEDKELQNFCKSFIQMTLEVLVL